MRLRGKTIAKLGRWFWFIIWIKDLAKKCRTQEEALEEGELEFEIIPAVLVWGYRIGQVYPPCGKKQSVAVRRPKAPNVPKRRRSS